MGEVKFVSNRIDVEISLPESCVCQSETEPDVPVRNIIPAVIDLATHDRARLVEKIFDASQEFGFFQVINHGISKGLIDQTMRIFKEFHDMSPEDKERECSKDPNINSKLTSNEICNVIEQAYEWRDALVFHCHPLEKYVHFWPQNPPKYREVVGAYCVGMRKLALEILGMISEGLGLEKGELEGEITENPLVVVNIDLKCPNPSLTFGLGQHSDSTLITIVFQDLNGLQYLKDAEWVAVHPLDHALLVHVGYNLEVVSNGQLKAAEHRVVTNIKTSRQTITYQVHPKVDVILEPAKCLINEINPQHYRSVVFKEFREKFLSFNAIRDPVMKYLTSNMPS